MATEIETRLKDMLSEISPLEPDEISDSTDIIELGMSSLQLQIFAAQVESAFDFRFDEGELGEIDRFDKLVAVVTRATGS